MALLYINDDDVQQQFSLVFAAKHTSQNVICIINELKSESCH